MDIREFLYRPEVQRALTAVMFVLLGFMLGFAVSLYIGVIEYEPVTNPSNLPIDNLENLLIQENLIG